MQKKNFWNNRICKKFHNAEVKPHNPQNFKFSRSIFKFNSNGLVFLAVEIDIVSDLFYAFLALVYVLACVLIPKILQQKKKISKFAARKAVHFLAGLTIFVTPYLTIPWFAVAIASIMTIVTYKSSKHSSSEAFKGLYAAIGEEAEEAKGYLQGPFHYALAITLLISAFAVVFQATGLSLFYLPIAGILVMVISDTLASVIGRKWGKHEIHVPWIKTKRTLEGSLAFLVSGWLLCFFAFGVFGVFLPGYSIRLSLPNAMILSIVAAAIGSVVEVITPSTWDDITIPIATTAIISLLAFSLQLIVID